MGSMGRHCGLGSMGAVNSRLDPVRRLECLPVSLWRVPLGQHAYNLAVGRLGWGRTRPACSAMERMESDPGMRCWQARAAPPAQVRWAGPSCNCS